MTFSISDLEKIAKSQHATNFQQDIILETIGRLKRIRNYKISFFQALNQFDKNLVSKDGEGFTNLTEIETVRGKDNYKRLSEMILYASQDLDEIAEQEMKTLLRNEKHLTGKPEYIGDYLALKGEAEMDKIVHQYVLRLSTIIDNLYYVVADKYGIKTSKGKDDKNEIKEGLKGKNNKLRRFLNGTFCRSPVMKEITKLRNMLAHTKPRFSITSHALDENHPNKYRYMIKSNGEEKSLFSYLEGMYKKVLENTTKVYEIILVKT